MTSEELRCRRGSLESSIDRLNRLMVGFTFVVAIGLIIEWNQPTFGLFGLHDFGGLLVTGGVSGELLMAFIAQLKEHRLRIVNADVESEDNKKLKTADERIALLDKEAAQFREKAAALELELERTKQAISVAEKRAVQASIRTQEEIRKRTPEKS